MNPELEKYIDFVVADGEVTEKEKAILIKKAEDLGVDLDEMEMVLDAKLHMIQKEAPQQEAPVPPAPSQESSSTNKCPQCAAVIESFSTRCPYCDSEVRNVKTAKSVTAFFNGLNCLEQNKESAIEKVFTILSKVKNNPQFLKYLLVGTMTLVVIIIASKFFFSERFVQIVLSSLFLILLVAITPWFYKSLGMITDKKVSTYISNFPVPNTREDILEFLSLAVPKAKQHGSLFTKNQPHNMKHNNMVPVWKNKCEQIIIKARFAMEDDKKTLEKIEAYASELRM